MRKLAFLGACLAATSVLLGASIASAAYVDFRDPANQAVMSTGPADPPTDTWKINTATADGVTVTVSSTPDNQTAISWEANDGFGVYEPCKTGTTGGYEWDEIEGQERLIVNFSEPVTLTSILLTDLFKESGYTEYGYIEFYDANGAKVRTDLYVDAVQSTGTNGEKTVVTGVQGVTVSQLVFRAPGKTGTYCTSKNREYAVGQISFEKTTGVPELDPRSAAGGLSLAICGLLIALGRRRSDSEVVPTV